jgi:hypothetical protein
MSDESRHTRIMSLIDHSIARRTFQSIDDFHLYMYGLKRSIISRVTRHCMYVCVTGNMRACYIGENRTRSILLSYIYT